MATTRADDKNCQDPVPLESSLTTTTTTTSPTTTTATTTITTTKTTKKKKKKTTASPQLMSWVYETARENLTITETLEQQQWIEQQ